MEYMLQVKEILLHLFAAHFSILSQEIAFKYFSSIMGTLQIFMFLYSTYRIFVFVVGRAYGDEEFMREMRDHFNIGCGGTLSNAERERTIKKIREVVCGLKKE